MKKLLFVALLGLYCPTLLFGTHVITSYAEYEIDSASGLMSVEYHVVLDSTGIAFTQNTITAQGPNNFVLNRDAVIPFVGRIGGPFCSGAVYYEVIFKASGIALPSANSSTLYTYDICPVCCINQIQNLQYNNARPCAIISVTAQPDGQGGFFYPSMSTIGTRRRLMQEAYADLDNLNDFGQNFFAGVDSVRFSLDGMPQGGGTIAPFLPGFSISTPLPDVSEDSLNGQNVFIPGTGVLRSMAVDSGFIEGNYAVGMARTTYFKGQPYTVDRSAYLVYYHYRDTSIAPIDLRISTPDSTFQTNDPTTHLSYLLDVGDSLVVDLTALGQVGDVVVLLSDSQLELLDTAALPSGSNYGLPELISLNPGGGFVNLDSNSVRFSFVPTIDNIRYMRERNFFKLVFGQNTCGGDVHSVLIEVQLEQTPRILVWGEEVDTAAVCVGLNPQLEAFKARSNFQWSPAALFSSATNRITSVTAQISRWYYLLDSSTGIKMDSIYLDFEPISATTFPISVDSIASRMVLNDPKASQWQRWVIGDLITLESQVEDELPIMGPGEYRVLSRFGPLECPHFSDTAFVPNNTIWASNYGRTQGADSVAIDTQTNQNTSYRFRLRPNQGVKHISDLYIKGLRDVNDNISARVIVTIEDNRGSIRSNTIILYDQTFIHLALSETLSSADRLDITLELVGHIEYHKLTIPSASFTAGDFDYSNHRLALGAGNFQTSNLTLPIGLRYVDAIGLEELSKANLISVFPSPTTGLLQVTGDELKGKSWKLSALGGTKLMEGAFDGDETEIDITHLPAGIYLLSVDGQVLKVVKE